MAVEKGRTWDKPEKNENAVRVLLIDERTVRSDSEDVTVSYISLRNADIQKGVCKIPTWFSVSGTVTSVDKSTLSFVVLTTQYIDGSHGTDIYICVGKLNTVQGGANPKNDYPPRRR